MGERTFLRRATRAVGVIATLLCASLLLQAPPEAAAAPPWGACGRSTDENKVVRVFPSPQGPLTLFCGGPIRSSTPEWGYRHILWAHMKDFDGASTGTFQNWRDIADLAMETIAADPDATYPARGDQTCRSRVLFLKDLRTNQVVRQGIFVMYTQNGTNRINTVFPRNYQCGPGL